ncbi:trypsin-like peptidase domain-containing protein [Pseudomonas entomophila]|uniref:trypsin-like serine peptidase n=1 Tax=Pseudomonas entomophila TaxID=312306 RepID=UPI001BCB9489|nr:serine protease [Pseudomonas entomophila]QVM91787.1 trypsin-like peptidase domain-containing protein [Pseudomonas entomophila]
MDYGQGQPTRSDPVLLANSQGQNHHWSGIGRLELPGNGHCIGSLIDTRRPDGQADGPAYVVTAGHCVSKQNGVIVHDQPLQASITFNYFADTLDDRRRFATRRTLWSSIQGSDLALLELQAPLQHLLDSGIEPLALAPPLPSGSGVLLVGEVVAMNVGLRRWACTEHDLPVSRTPPSVLRNLKGADCPRVAEGASGSPILDRASNRIVGVANHSNGQQIESTPVNRLLDCFSDGQADLSVDRCHLLPGFQLHQQRSDFKTLHKLSLDAQAHTPLPRWNFGFTLDTPRYRYKTTRDARACENPEDYSGTLPAEGTVLIDAPIGPDPGWHYLCIVGVVSAEGLAWRGLMRNALSIAVELLPALPVPSPDLDIEHLENGDIRVAWRTAPPHLQRYRVKKGKPEQVDCADPAGYRLLRHEQFVFKQVELPMKLCSQAEDATKQRSAPRTDLLQAR